MGGVLKPFCDLLAAKDDKTVGVVLDGIANILATAEKLQETDKVAMMVEECGGLDRIRLSSHTRMSKSTTKHFRSLRHSFLMENRLMKRLLLKLERLDSSLQLARVQCLSLGSTSEPRNSLFILHQDLLFVLYLLPCTRVKSMHFSLLMVLVQLMYL